MDKAIEKKYKFLSKKTLWIALGSIFFIFVIYNIFFGDKSSKLNVEKEKITIESIKEDQFKDYIPVIGTVEPIQTVFLDAVQGGRVDKILIEEGNMVKKGDIIMKLSNDNLLLNMYQTETTISRTINDLQNTKITLENNQIGRQQNFINTQLNLKQQERLFKYNEKLYSEKHISDEDYIQSEELFKASLRQFNLLKETLRNDSIFKENQIASINSQIASMRENLVMVRARKENLNVRAPVDGELASLLPEIGQVVNYGERIGTVNILTSYKLSADIDEHYIARVVRDLPGNFDFTNQTYRLKIKKILPVVNNGRFTVDMVFVADQPDQMRIGQTHRIKLELGESKQAILIPRGGFYQSTGGQWVYVVDESGDFAVKRNIRIGRQNPKFYEVLEGLEPGEQVVVSSYDNFGDVDQLILK